MCKKTLRKSRKVMSLLLVVVLILGMLPIQVFAAETDSVSIPEIIETTDQLNTTKEENDILSEESLTENEVIVPEEGVITLPEQILEMFPAEESIQEITLSESCIVAFDPDDGQTGYNDFFKVTVPVGGTVTGKPNAPIRDGYFFMEWYAYEDENGNPVFWDFNNDTVEDNTTLWAAWEKGCIVMFDPDDGQTGYDDFFKVTVSVGSTVTSKPDDPTRDGYLFKGWHAYEDENGDPVFWDFNNGTVEDNITLWAAWEKGCIVMFDPDDGQTGYNEFFKVTVPVGSTVTGKPDDPTRNGYLFKGWYAYLDENSNPVLWDFSNGTVEDNTTLWAAWEKGCIVIFDPDDGQTGYNDFFKVTVPVGSTVIGKPDDPTRNGYLFKGWYSYLDENSNPVLWDFSNGTVEDNTTLWAAWEKGCIVIFDPDDGQTEYNDFFKVTVPVGSTVIGKPDDPTRNGYLFKGWYSYLDENSNPVLWDFSNGTVEDNTTLWAAWEKGCIVIFDPDDGQTEYNGFFKVTVPVGSTITSKPDDPTREGYLFKGWYAYEDENSNPVYWDFNNGTVENNTTLWAAWEKEDNGGESSGGGESNGGGSGGSGNNSGGSSGSGTNSGGSSGGGTNSNGNYIDIENEEIPHGSFEIENEEIPFGSLELADIPKTGDSNSTYLLLWMLCGISFLGMGILLLPRSRAVI